MNKNTVKGVFGVNMVTILFNTLVKFMKKEGITMMAMFFAQRVILGKTKFAEVPNVLKARVREILIECGLEELATEE